MSKDLWQQAVNKQAIALHYDAADKTAAPQLTAKGSNELAEAILAIARQHNIPVFENPALLSLLNTLELGDEIPPLLYQSIAEIIAFTYRLNDMEDWSSCQ